MKTYTLQDIQDLSPCYPATEHLPEDWTGTLVDMLQVESCPHEDRIWVVTKLLDDKTNRLFAVWCAREALKLVDSPDVRSIAACDVAERYAHGNATAEELKAARDDAWAAMHAVAYAASATAWAAARAATATASATASAAARAAADAASATARAAARAAADAANSDTNVVVKAAANAAMDAGDTDIQQAQIDKLIEMIEELT